MFKRGTVGLHTLARALYFFVRLSYKQLFDIITVLQCWQSYFEAKINQKLHYRFLLQFEKNIHDNNGFIFNITCYSHILLTLSDPKLQ